MVAEHDRWTVYNSKVNLPAALNDPRLTKRESDFFTKTWGLDFAETEVMPSFYLPNITKENFGPYLQETAQVTQASRFNYSVDLTEPVQPGQVSVAQQIDCRNVTAVEYAWNFHRRTIRATGFSPSWLAYVFENLM